MVWRHCTTEKIEGVIRFGDDVAIVLRPCKVTGEENSKITMVKDVINRSAINGIIVEAGMR